MEGRETVMGTYIRAEISKKNKYWIDRHRYYELKHFCLQYKFWQEAFLSIDSIAGKIPEWVPISNTGLYSNPTERAMMARKYYRDKIKMVEKAAQLVDPVLGYYILKAVTEGRSYESMKARHNVPCGRDLFYENYRKFFWILNKMRQ